MADKDTEWIKFHTELLRFAVLAVFAVGGGSLGLLLGQRTLFRVSLALTGLLVTIGLLVVGWRLARRLQQRIDELKE
jgi:hypothetical protein